MCAICGVGIFRNAKIDPEKLEKFFTELFISCRAGGEEASGISIMGQTKAAVLKHNVSSIILTRTEKYKNIMHQFLDVKNRNDLPYSIIGHCRFPTKGSPQDNRNNHPLVSGNIIGVHNGMISNDDELFQSFNIERQGLVDTEIIFTLLNFFLEKEGSITTAVDKTLEKIHGGYSCAVQIRIAPHLLLLFRNYNNAEIYVYENLGFFAFATNNHYLKYAEDKTGIGKGTSFHYDMNTSIIIDVMNKKICRRKHKESWNNKTVTRSIGLLGY